MITRIFFSIFLVCITLSGCKRDSFKAEQFLFSMHTDQTEKGLHFCVEFYRPHFLGLREGQQLRDHFVTGTDFRKKCNPDQAPIFICKKERLTRPIENAKPERNFHTISYFFKGTDIKKASESYECRVMSGEADQVEVSTSFLE